MLLNREVSVDWNLHCKVGVLLKCHITSRVYNMNEKHNVILARGLEIKAVVNTSVSKLASGIVGRILRS